MNMWKEVWNKLTEDIENPSLSELERGTFRAARDVLLVAAARCGSTAEVYADARTGGYKEACAAVAPGFVYPASGAACVLASALFSVWVRHSGETDHVRARYSPATADILNWLGVEEPMRSIIGDSWGGAFASDIGEVFAVVHPLRGKSDLETDMLRALQRKVDLTERSVLRVVCEHLPWFISIGENDEQVF